MQSTEAKYEQVSWVEPVRYYFCVKKATASAKGVVFFRPVVQKSTEQTQASKEWGMCYKARGWKSSFWRCVCVLCVSRKLLANGMNVAKQANVLLFINACLPTDWGGMASMMIRAMPVSSSDRQKLRRDKWFFFFAPRILVLILFCSSFSLSIHHGFVLWLQNLERVGWLWRKSQGHLSGGNENLPYLFCRRNRDPSQAMRYSILFGVP